METGLTYMNTHTSGHKGKTSTLLNSQPWELGVCVALCQGYRDSVVIHSLPFSRGTLFASVLGRCIIDYKWLVWRRSGRGAGGERWMFGGVSGGEKGCDKKRAGRRWVLATCAWCVVSKT